jgi:hypothetical protein
LRWHQRAEEWELVGIVVVGVGEGRWDWDPVVPEEDVVVKGDLRSRVKCRGGPSEKYHR